MPQEGMPSLSDTNTGKQRKPFPLDSKGTQAAGQRPQSQTKTSASSPHRLETERPKSNKS